MSTSRPRRGKRKPKRPQAAQQRKWIEAVVRYCILRRMQPDQARRIACVDAPPGLSFGSGWRAGDWQDVDEAFRKEAREWRDAHDANIRTLFWRPPGYITRLRRRNRRIRGRLRRHALQELRSMERQARTPSADPQAREDFPD